jgi:hypothetical protein
MFTRSHPHNLILGQTTNTVHTHHHHHHYEASQEGPKQEALHSYLSGRRSSLWKCNAQVVVMMMTDDDCALRYINFILVSAWQRKTRGSGCLVVIQSPSPLILAPVLEPTNIESGSGQLGALRRRRLV